MPLLGNSTNNCLGTVPCMKNNPDMVNSEREKANTGSANKKMVKTAGPDSSLEAKGLFASISSHTADKEPMGETMSHSSSLSKSKPRRASLLELTTTLDIFLQALLLVVVLIMLLRAILEAARTVVRRVLRPRRPQTSIYTCKMMDFLM